MSYDPYDGEFETVISDILNAFECCPIRAKKTLLTSLFERIATFKTMYEEKGEKVTEENFYFILTTKFDNIEALRTEEARRFLGELMKRELP